MNSFLRYLHTKEDTAYIREKLSKLSREAFKVQKPFQKKIFEVFSVSLAEEFLKMAEEKKVNLADSAACEAFIKQLIGEIQSMPSVKLHLSFEPSYDLLSNISKWFEDVAGRPVIIDYVVNPDLIGGALIEWNGKYFNYSLQKLIREKMVGN